VSETVSSRSGCRRQQPLQKEVAALLALLEQDNKPETNS